jgi:hypothetical protein
LADHRAPETIYQAAIFKRHFILDNNLKFWDIISLMFNITQLSKMLQQLVNQKLEDWLFKYPIACMFAKVFVNSRLNGKAHYKRRKQLFEYQHLL